MRFRFRFWVLGVAAILVSSGLLGVATPASGVVSANLITNPGAEAGPGSSDGVTVDVPPGWTTSSNFTAIQYGASGGFPSTSVASSIGGGTNFFGGGNDASSTAVQVIDVSSSAAAIDSGGATAALSGFLGGFSNQEDNMVVAAQFLSAADTTLGSITIGPVTATDRGDVTTLLSRSTSGTVPAGTRSIKITMTATRVTGTANDAYADNLSLTLDTPAVPAAAPFSIDPFSLTLHPGDSFTVTGSGCPPNGTLPTDQPLSLRLTPPRGGNAWGPTLLDGRVAIISTAAGIPGESNVTVLPNADGTFQASITVPFEAPAGSGYTVRGICATLLEPGTGPGGFTQASWDASSAQAGALEVVAPPPVVIQPNFTG